MLINCKKCGERFLTYKSRVNAGKGKYCSVACRHKRIEKTCEKCGKGFKVISSRNKARFCSRQCSIKGKVNKTCKVCTQEFFVYPAFEKAKFCSRKCQGISKRGKPSPMRGKKNPGAAKNPQIFKKGFTPWNKGRPHMQGADHPNWKGGINLKNERIRKSLKWKVWREAVYKRDRWTCRVCGYKGKDIVAHHIKVFSKYPKLRFKVSNGAVLCRTCHVLIHNPRRKDYVFKPIYKDLLKS